MALPIGLLLCYPYFMMKSISAIPKKRGRPKTTGRGTLLGVRMLDEPLQKLDAWIADKREPDLSRPEAIRRLVELGLTIKPKARPRAPDHKDRARELAGKVIDKMSDVSATDDDKAGRKRRLIKGPEEFRDARVDRSKRTK